MNNQFQMKALKLLNKNFKVFCFIFFYFLYFNLNSNEPVDIWNLEKIEDNIKIENDNNSIIKNKINKNKEKSISKRDFFKEEELTLNDYLIGLFDPQKNNLSIDMWSRSDGDQVKAIMKKINNLELSDDASELLKITLLTNSYSPKNNITNKEFTNYKINFLLQKNDLDLIEEFIKKNGNDYNRDVLVRHYIDYFLLYGDLKKSCELIDILETSSSNDYIEKFKIYCFINNNKFEEAQLLFDLKKEAKFNDEFFEKKFFHIMGINEDENNDISQKNILDFHLSHRTNKKFSFIPDKKTEDFIWKYLSNYNLLEGVDDIDLEDGEKIKTIEKATHEGNYKEKDLLNLYKRFQFNVDQLINVKETYKLLPSYKSRAILYQRIILTFDTKEKIDLIFRLKDLMVKDDIPNAFNTELSKLIKTLEKEQIPSNYTNFYNDNLKQEGQLNKKIKFNNKIIHKSKLINYFTKDQSLEKTSKDTNEILKKVKSNKEYVFSNMDKIVLDSLISDGVKKKKNYLDLYEQNPNIPIDLQVFINDNNVGMILLRLVEIIGEDKYKDLGTETLYFITTVLNQINLDSIRNQIILDILQSEA